MPLALLILSLAKSARPSSDTALTGSMMPPALRTRKRSGKHGEGKPTSFDEHTSNQPSPEYGYISARGARRVTAPAPPHSAATLFPN